MINNQPKKSQYNGPSYYCQYADSYMDCGDKKCSECNYYKKAKTGAKVKK